MAPTLKHRSLAEIETLSAPDMSALVARASEMLSWQRAGGAAADALRQALRGKNLALLCSPSHDHDAVLFTRAAVSLGAQVAPLRPSLSARSTPAQVQRMARVLGQLYDAVACLGVATELVRRIQADAGVPVFEDLGTSAHATHGLAGLLGHGPSSDESRCAVIQAVLLKALA